MLAGLFLLFAPAAAHRKQMREKEDLEKALEEASSEARMAIRQLERVRFGAPQMTGMDAYLATYRRIVYRWSVDDMAMVLFEGRVGPDQIRYARMFVESIGRFGLARPVSDGAVDTRSLWEFTKEASDVYEELWKAGKFKKPMAQQEPQSPPTI